MVEGDGFTVRAHRRVKMDDDLVEKEGNGDETTERQGSSPPEGEAGTTNEMPPVDFAGFVLGLAQMALIHLGEISPPGSETTSKDLVQARQSIDIIDMLEAKTRGNLTANEVQLLESLKRELKLKYVHAARSA